MDDAPLQNGPDGATGVARERLGRDPKTGRFLPHNSFGLGNPDAVAGSRLRAAWKKAVTVDDLVAILRQLITWARGGDRWAIGLLFDYYLRLPARSNDDAHTLQGLVRLIENDGPGRR